MSNTIPSAQLLERLHWRYATKQFDPSRKISAADWAVLEDVLVLSPSSGGLQPWKFVVVNDPAVREKLLPAAFGQTQVVQASHLVIFAAKTDVSEVDVDAHLAHVAEVRHIPVETLASYRGMLVGGIVNAMDRPTRLAWASRQAAIALGNFLTSAALLGIDACPMEGFSAPQVDEILGLKEKGLTSVVFCPLGYRSETDGYATLPKVRFPKSAVILHI